MDGMASLGKTMIFVGVVIIVFGAILVLARLSGGRGGVLPGDIVVRRDHVTFYFPIVTSIVISVVLTLVLWLIAASRR
jgi:hypothetical protein